MNKLRLVKKIKSKSDKTLRIDLYADNKDTKYLVKTVSTSNPRQIQLLNNEVNILNLLYKYSESSTILFPRIISVTKESSRMLVTRRFYNGKNIKNKRQSYKVKTHEVCLEELKKISLKITRDRTIKKRKLIHQFLTFPYFYLRSLIKDPSHIKWLNMTFFNFYISHFDFHILNPRYSLAHRDLTSQNLISYKKKVVLIDFETALFAEENTDLALFPRFYYREVSSNKINDYLRKKITSKSDLRQFIRLTSFYAVHFLTVVNKNTYYYNEAKNYIPYLFNTILPNLSDI